MQKRILILDTGVILPFCYIDFPISKKKVIEKLLDNFDIFIPKEVEEEMQRPKPRLKREECEEISYIWSQIRMKINKKNPPESCLNTVLEEENNIQKTDLKVLALGLYLSRSCKVPVFLSTHENKAFLWFNFISRKQQLGYVFSPFDVLTFMCLYLDLPYEEVDYVWRELSQFTGIKSTLSFRPIVYDQSPPLCLRYCKTKECTR